jgi:hypothetical protein
MKTSMKRLPHGLSVGVGTAVGTLLYTGFLSAAQEVDWYRAVFVGAFCGLIAAAWPRKKQ